MSSGEQTALAVVGAGIGFVASGGNPMGALYGAQIGMALGASTLSTTLPGTEGPRLSDLSTQNAAYGTSIPKTWGTMAHAGIVIWSSGLNETKTTVTQENDGKGGPSTSQSHTTFSYDASFAVLYHDGETKGVRRIWANEYLIYDNGAIDDYGALSDEEAGDWAFTKAVGLKDGEGTLTFYSGTETQDPDPTIQSYEGAANTPAFRGYSYVVFTSLLLERFGNRIPQIKIEYVAVDEDPSTSDTNVVTHDYSALVDSDSVLGRRLSTVDEDMVCHLFVNEWDNAKSNETMRYYKWFPTKTLTYVKTWEMNDGQPFAVKTDYNSNIAGITAEVPSIISTQDVITDGNLHYWQPEGSLHNPGDMSKTTLSITGLGSIISFNHTTKPFYQIGSIREGKILFWVDTTGLLDPTFRLYSYDKYVNVSLLGFVSTAWNVYYTDLTLTSSQKMGFALSENYIYVATTGDILYQYNHAGEELNAWDFSSEPNCNWNLTSNAHGVFVDRKDETIVYVYNQQYLHRITNGVYEYLGDSTRTSSPDAGSGIHFIAGLQVYQDRGNLTMYVDTLGNLAKTGESLDVVVSNHCTDSGLTAGDIDVTALAGTTVDGYTKSRVSTAGKNIENLMMAYQFSAYEDEHKLIFRFRGGSVDKVIDADDLAAGLDAPSSAILPYSRIDDQNLPLKVNLTYFDVNRKYDVNTQSAQRSAIYDTQQVLSVEVPLVLTADTARQIAEKILQAAWSARVDYKQVRLPHKYGDIVPTDILQVENQGITHTIRATNVNLGEFLELTGISENDADYNSIISGFEQESAYEGTGYPGPTRSLFLDLPPLRDSDVDVGFYWAAHGFVNSWTGATLWAEGASGGYSNAKTVINDATVGVVENVLPPQDWHVMDGSSYLDVRFINGSVSSVTKAQLLANRSVNAAAVGAHGRWEIIQFQTVTDNGDGSYRLTNLIRGQAGTDAFVRYHEANEHFVVLDSAALERVTTAEINVQYFYRAVSLGLPFGYGTDQSFVNAGQSVKPFAPCHIRAVNVGRDRWAISWTRRPRASYDLRDFVDAATLEETSSFTVEIYTASLEASEYSEITTETVSTTVAGGVSELTTTGYGRQVLYLSQNGSLYGQGQRSHFIYLENDTTLNTPDYGNYGAYVHLNVKDPRYRSDVDQSVSAITHYYAFEPAQVVENLSLSPTNQTYLLSLTALTYFWGTSDTEYYENAAAIEGSEPTFSEETSLAQNFYYADFSANPSGTGSASAYLDCNGGPLGCTPDDGHSTSLWFEPDGVKTDCVIIGRTNYHIRFTSTGIRIIRNGSNVGDLLFTMPTSGWHHVAVVRHKDTDDFEAWLDGELVATVTTSASLDVQMLYVGVERTGSHSRHTTWNYARFRHYAGALTGTQINDLATENFEDW